MSVSNINNILYSPSVSDPVTKHANSAGEFFLDRFRKLNNKVILIDGQKDIKTTASEFCEQITHFARCLQALGIKEGDVVKICCENRLEFFNTIFGVMLINATLAPCSFLYTERELEHVFAISKPKIIFTSKKSIENVIKVVKRNSFVDHVICFDDVQLFDVMSYSNFLSLSKEESSINFKVPPVNKQENLMLILYSSGTTGFPKGVELTQANLLSKTDIAINHNQVPIGTTVFCILPLFHAAGYILALNYTARGMKYLFLERFQDHRFLKCIEFYKVEMCILVPSLLVFLAKSSIVDQYDFSSVKLISSSTAPVQMEVVEAVKKRIGVSIILNGYGLTECTGGVITQSVEHKKAGSIGRLRSGLYCKVIDTGTGKPLGPNQSGELCFKGPLLMRGYAGDRRATKQIIDKDGWLHSGDIGYYDEEFDFFIVDRIKELIKYKGSQVPPVEIESLLLTHPKIKDVAVIGVRNEEAGELPMAFVVKQSDVDLSVKEVIDFVAKRASPAKRLHGGVRFVDDIPRNATGKILRRVLRDKVKREQMSKL